jgi:hypothetical protein
MYITRLAEKFKVNSGLVMNPIENRVTRCSEPGEESEEEANKNLYRSLIGGLLYVATCTRPDILYAIGYLSRILNKPKIRKMRMAMRLLGYLMSTKKEGIFYAKLEKPPLSIPEVELFCDSDLWGPDISKPTYVPCNGKSTTSVLILIAKGLIMFKSKRQTCVERSSPEAEIYALAEGVAQLSVIYQMLYGLFTDTLVFKGNIYSDNVNVFKTIKQGYLSNINICLKC